ncbi:MAG: hypothetical protein L3J24_06460 [Xanthomonadales bacterium]|nr:hypothetical protein [Xanthomonadales bacterium]
MSWLSLEGLLSEQTGSELATAAILKAKSRKKQNEWDRLQLLSLNDVICSADDVYSFRSVSTRPNFIGKGRHRAAIRHLTLTNIPHENLDNCIICIEFADPGWDWVFTHRIAGIITQYGGPNSHIAVRCAEFGIPAVLGCGQRLFNSVLNARQVDVDCDGETIEVVC